MFAFGNLLRECGVVDRLADTSRNALINIVTIALGLTVGSKLSAEAFLQMKTLGILVLGMVAFCGGTAAGIFMAKVMRSEEHTSELQSLMRISYAVFCLKKKINNTPNT